MIKENDGLFYHEFIKSIKKRFNTHFDKNKHVIVHGIKGDMHDYIVKIRIEAGANHSSVLINFVYFDDLIKMMDCKYNFADLLAREVQSIENDLMKTFNLVNPYYDQDHDINFDQVVGEMVVFYKKLNEMLKICLK